MLRLLLIPNNRHFPASIVSAQGANTHCGAEFVALSALFSEVRRQSGLRSQLRRHGSSLHRARASIRYRPPLGGCAARSPDAPRRAPRFEPSPHREKTMPRRDRGLTTDQPPCAPLSLRWSFDRILSPTPPVRRISRLAMRVRRTNRSLQRDPTTHISVNSLGSPI
jgi:hypothetical protein